MTTGIVIYMIPPEQMWEDLRDYYYTTKSQDLFYFPVTWSTGAILVLQIVKKKNPPFTVKQFRWSETTFANGIRSRQQIWTFDHHKSWQLPQSLLFWNHFKLPISHHKGEHETFLWPFNSPKQSPFNLILSTTFLKVTPRWDLFLKQISHTLGKNAVA